MIPSDVLRGVIQVHGELDDPGVPSSFAVVWDDDAGETILHCLVGVFPWDVEPLFDRDDVFDVMGDDDE